MRNSSAHHFLKGLSLVFAVMSMGINAVHAQEAKVIEAQAESQTLQATPSLPLRIVVNPVPDTKSDSFFRKTANETPSGYAVPRYVSLKFGKINGRTGPSRDHAIAWQYRRRGLPLIVVAETENWRKVRDINGDESWVRKSGLTGERFIMTLGETTLYAKPRPAAKPVATSEGGALMKLEECNGDGWCRVKAGNGIRGWASNRHLWGAQKL